MLSLSRISERYEFKRKLRSKANQRKARLGELSCVYYFGCPFGWHVFLTNLDPTSSKGKWRINAGCRFFTLKEARAHWSRYLTVRSGVSRVLGYRAPFTEHEAAQYRTRGAGMLAMIDLMEKFIKYPR